MEHVYRYIGCFFPQEHLLSYIAPLGYHHLEQMIAHPHITFAYRPDSVDESLFGETITIRATAYGNDGENEGLKVELISACPKLTKAFQAIAVPHITLSISAEGKAVNTGSLQFHQIEPFELTGIYGGYEAETENVILTSQAYKNGDGLAD